MASDDLKSAALNSSQDFYALLSIPEGASESEIRSAYRKTARKYHPDKVGANEEALKTFHLLQIAYDVLSDPTIKELYDNARRARQAKAERDQAYEGRRKWMKEDLERRENSASKRKREEVDAEDEFERELRRIAENGKRRRKEREEMLRREWEEENKREDDGDDVVQDTNGDRNAKAPIEEIDRSVTMRFPQNETTSHVDRAEVIRRFERFGPIDEAILRDKKIKPEGQKHRQPYTTVLLVFKSVVGAHAAMTDFPQASTIVPDTFGVFEAVTWASGEQPAFIPPSKPKTSTYTPVSNPTKQANPVQNATNGSKKVPSFASFKNKPAAGNDGPGLDDITMIRLKNAERRRMEEKIRREEAEAEMVEGEDAK